MHQRVQQSYVAIVGELNGKLILKDYFYLLLFIYKQLAHEVLTFSWVDYFWFFYSALKFMLPSTRQSTFNIAWSFPNCGRQDLACMLRYGYFILCYTYLNHAIL